MRLLGFLIRLKSEGKKPRSRVEECQRISDPKGRVSVGKEKKEWNQLHTAARDGDITKMESFLSGGICIDSQESTHKTPLMIAAFNGKLRVVKCLIENGADMSLVDNSGWNTLHFASQGGNPDIIDLIASHVADIDLRAPKAFTPLMVAADNGRLNAVKYLLKSGADLSLEDDNGWKPLHHAARGGNTAVIELFLSDMEEIDPRANRGETPLMIAGYYGNLQAVKYLLEKGADPSLRDKRRWNSLHHASRGVSPAVIELLLNHVPDIDSTTGQLYTPLMIAAGNGRLEIVELLVRKKAKSNVKDNNGYAAIDWALHSQEPRSSHYYFARPALAFEIPNFEQCMSQYCNW